MDTRLATIKQTVEGLRSVVDRLNGEAVALLRTLPTGTPEEIREVRNKARLLAPSADKVTFFRELAMKETLCKEAS